jgi:hypothetical protein
MSEPQQGDWVQVWARVEGQEQVHPEDLRISVDSHNAVPEAIIVVRRDRVIKPEGLPDHAERCTRLGAYGGDPEYLLRCTRHEGHSGLHESPLLDWDEKSTVGYIEEA